MGRFDGKVMLLTGSAAALQDETMGFGGASAWRFLREGGAGVMLTDVQDDLGEKSAAQMRGAGFKAHYRHLDVTNEPEWQSVIDDTLTEFGRLDVVVNIAGIIDPRRIEDTALDEWKRVMDVTTVGVFLGTKLGAAAMKKTGGGSIINMSSMAAKGGGAYGSAYATSRVGIVNFSKAAAIQYGPDKIRVNVVEPGWVRTPFTAKIYADEAQRQWRESRVPLGRFGEPEEIASCVLFLASDDASYVTGAEILADGGVSAGNTGNRPAHPDAK